MSRRAGRAAIGAMLLVASCARSSSPPRAAEPSPATPLHFLLVNDVYIADTLRDGSGGVARVATLRRSLARRGPVIFVLAGDVLSPSLLSKWYAGRQMVEVLDVARLDYATFGNHEFELDRDTLVARIAGSHFRWLSSNCTQADGAPFPGVRGWDTLSVQGVRYGLFALTLQGDYRRYVRCANPDSAAHATIEILRALGAQRIVGITHQNLSADSVLLAREQALSLILGGHEHEWHDVIVGRSRVVKADANARSAQLVTMDSAGPSAPPAATLVRIDARLPADTATAMVVRSWSDSVLRRLGPPRLIGELRAPLDGRDALSRRRESPLGDLVADGIRSGTGADVALINSGTLRLDDVLQPGAITSYQIESIFLFADETRIVTFPLGAARLREVIEHGLAEHGHGGFLQLSGILVEYDLSRPSGSRIVGELKRSDGRPLRGDETLRVAFDVYPACAHGDGYVVPEAAASCESAAGAPRAADLVIAHISGRLGGIVAMPTPGRLVER
ncbi:MAG: bifunctional metallophosphatase/5'-nucleotidase [Gemmatimonadota bacterium]|nr:bifunctional metallophosphatase/5'-nucleotidase [Gemmatimonadota bacterium]